jgi:RND family efflux transporter MFP subunit
MRKGVVLAALLAGVVALAGCGSDKQVEVPAKAPSGPRLTVAMSDAPDWQSVSAEVTTRDQAQVLARIPGILSSLSVRAGDSVRRGQSIGRITDNQLGFQASAYGAQAAAAGAQAGQAKAELDRVRFLYQNGVYAKARLDQAEAAASATVAQVSAARAQQSSVNAMAGQGAVVAPSDGRVLRADVPAGSPVTPGMVIAVVTSGPVLLRLDLPEGLAAKVTPGAKVQVDGLANEGTVTRVYPAVQAGQVSADVMLPGLDARLIDRRLPARVAAGTHHAMLVPKQFVTTRFGLDTVTVVARDGTAMRVPVQTAPAQGGNVEILSGVNVGDTLAGGPQ